MKTDLVVVGLLGGVASGKSTVAREFEKKGAAVLDADRMVHDLLNESPTIREIEQQFGKETVAADGSVDRKVLAAKVFQNPEQRKKLESILHPQVRQRIASELAALRKSRRVQMAILDVPLLMEGGLIESCEKVVFVNSPISNRRERAKKTRGWSEAEHALRESAQGNLEAKKKRADFVLENSGSPEQLEERVGEIYLQILKGK